jgi:modulator of FtsH protease
LLAMTLLFSALTAGVSIVMNPPHFTGLVTSILALLLLWFVLPRTANSAMGLAVVFGVTGLLGFGLGPLLNAYLNTANGSQIVMTALGGTGIIFLALSAYALTTKRDFSFMGGMLMVGMIVVVIAAIANIFLAMPALSLTISAVVILLMSGFILYDTGRIVNGGETNYILATVSLYLSIYNIFVSLLQLLGIFGGDD